MTAQLFTIWYSIPGIKINLHLSQTNFISHNNPYVTWDGIFLKHMLPNTCSLNISISQLLNNNFSRIISKHRNNSLLKKKIDHEGVRDGST